MAAVLRYGFKAQAEAIALALRAEIGLGSFDRVDCLVLAEHLAVPVISLPELRKQGAREANLTRLMSDGSGFSALTVCAGSRRLIVYNPSHPPGRQANSLSHELSHLIHDHPPMPALANGGCRLWDARLEAEADWQAGALLVPRAGALRWMKQGGDIEGGAHHFGVSAKLFSWRVNNTGVPKQLTRIRRGGTISHRPDDIKSPSR